MLRHAIAQSLNGLVRRHPEDLREAVLLLVLQERGVRCIQHAPSLVDREAPAVREDVLDSVDREERDLDLVHALDSVRGPAVHLALAAFCLDPAKVPRLAALLDVQHRAAVAASVTRRVKKAR